MTLKYARRNLELLLLRIISPPIGLPKTNKGTLRTVYNHCIISAREGTRT